MSKMRIKTETTAMEIVVWVGELLMESGAEIYRIEDETDCGSTWHPKF